MAEPLLSRQQALEPQDLLQDLSAGEIAAHSVEPAGTEHAPHRAPHLGADADRSMPAIVAKQHALDAVAVVQPEEQFLGSVFRFLPGRLGHGPEHERLAKFRPELLG